MRNLALSALTSLLLFASACGNSAGPLDPDAPGANMSEVISQLQMIATDDKKKQLVRTGSELKDATGATFFGAALKLEVVDDVIIKFLVIPDSGDGVADKAAVKSSGSLPAQSCSYASPKGQDLMSAMNAKGSKRKVLLCPNSRNWKRYGDTVPVYFSDGNAPVKLAFDEAAKSFNITRDEWDDPAGKLFGKKAPFDMVGE